MLRGEFEDMSAPRQEDNRSKKSHKRKSQAQATTPPQESCTVLCTVYTFHTTVVPGNTVTS